METTAFVDLNDLDELDKRIEELGRHLTLLENKIGEQTYNLALLQESIRDIDDRLLLLEAAIYPKAINFK